MCQHPRWLSGHDWSGIARRLTALQSEITDLRVASVAATAACEGLSARSDTLTQQLPQIRERLENTAAERAESEADAETLRGDIADCENRIKGYTLKLDSRAEKLRGLLDEL